MTIRVNLPKSVVIGALLSLSAFAFLIGFLVDADVAITIPYGLMVAQAYFLYAGVTTVKNRRFFPAAAILSAAALTMILRAIFGIEIGVAILKVIVCAGGGGTTVAICALAFSVGRDLARLRQAPAAA